jgi:hypothetical protein
MYIRTGLPPFEQAPTTTLPIPTTPSVSSSSRRLGSIVYTPKVEAGIVIHDYEAVVLPSSAQVGEESKVGFGRDLRCDELASSFLISLMS